MYMVDKTENASTSDTISKVLADPRLGTKRKKPHLLNEVTNINNMINKHLSCEEEDPQSVSEAHNVISVDLEEMNHTGEATSSVAPTSAFEPSGSVFTSQNIQSEPS